MLAITRRFEFDAGHRVLGHEGKCRHIHGHHYVADVTVTAEELNELGMVVDFSIIKSHIGNWIRDCWDHNFICHPDDPISGQTVLNGGRLPYTMTGNPTAENMAELLYNISKDLLTKYDIQIVSVRIYETPTCWADYHG